MSTSHQRRADHRAAQERAYQLWLAERRTREESPFSRRARSLVGDPFWDRALYRAEQRRDRTRRRYWKRTDTMVRARVRRMHAAYRRRRG